MDFWIFVCKHFWEIYCGTPRITIRFFCDFLYMNNTSNINHHSLAPSPLKPLKSNQGDQNRSGDFPQIVQDGIFVSILLFVLTCWQTLQYCRHRPSLIFGAETRPLLAPGTGLANSMVAVMSTILVVVLCQARFIHAHEMHCDRLHYQSYLPFIALQRAGKENTLSCYSWYATMGGRERECS